MIPVSEEWKEHSKYSSVYNAYAEIYLPDELVVTDADGESVFWIKSEIITNEDGSISIKEDNRIVTEPDGSIYLDLDGEIATAGADFKLILDGRTIPNDDKASTILLNSRIVTDSDGEIMATLDGTVEDETLIITGHKLELSDKDFMMGSIGWQDDISNVNEFRLGCAGIGGFRCTINNADGKFTGLDFKNSAIMTYVGYRDERILQGIYYIEKQQKRGINIELQGYDRFVSLDVPIDEFVRSADPAEHIGDGIVTPITWNSGATIGEIVNKIVQAAELKVSEINLENGVVKFPNDNIKTSISSEDLHILARELLDYCIEMAGCFCLMDYEGKLEIRQYKSMTEPTEITKITSIPIVDNDPYKIFGVLVPYEESYVTRGYEGYGTIYAAKKNPLIANESTANAVAEAIFNALFAIEFMEFSLSAKTDPTLEVGDFVSFKLGGSEYKTYLTSFSCNLGRDSNMSFEGDYYKISTFKEAWNQL